MTCAAPSRRELVLGAAAAAALSTRCSRPVRRSAWLSYLFGTEPDTIDPHKCIGGSEGWIIAALFEPLIQAYPETMAPMAGLATHYRIERDGTRYTFYLRGHPSPQGIRLPNADSLPVDFSPGRTAAPDDIPARWSDGAPITAHDVVYSWRRSVTPETGSVFANTLYCVAGAEAIASGKLSPEKLGVRALDAFTFQVDLRVPAQICLDRHDVKGAMITCTPPSRRQLFLAAATGAAFSGACGCARRREPGRLTYLLPSEPDTLDPAKSPGGPEVWIMSALFEPLLQPHPVTGAPIAGLATHYNVERDGTRYTFYLRGHPAPEGVRLPGTESLPAEFSRAREAGSYDIPSRWSDGTALTAHDIVYAWRRYLSPATGNPNANSLYCVAGAEAISDGKISSDELGVRAPDALTFQVDLHAPAPNFLLLCCSWLTLPLPRHAIEAARQRGREASWTEPRRMLTSGPFVLKESRARERTVISKNPYYFDADQVDVEEIQFSAADGVTVLNLFEAGQVDSMEGRVLPLQFVPRMRSKSEFHIRPACASHNWRISTKRAPLDDIRLRYALNMATDKQATTRFLGAGQIPARSRVPPLEGYRSAQSLLIEINGQPCDVLAYNPRAARDLWAAAGSAKARHPLPIHYRALADSHLLAEILQQQWRENLGVDTRLVPHEPAAYIRTILTDGDYSGVAEEPFVADYPDPHNLLSLYTANFANWSDPEFDRMLTAATSIADPALRMQKLADCEMTLLRAMPFVPLYFDTWVYLERPEVRGLSPGPMGYPSFKYAWIDDSRRTS